MRFLHYHSTLHLLKNRYRITTTLTNMASTTVFISGATGFIAQHTIKLLIQKGYNVIGSVRSDTKGEKLKKTFGKTFFYEVVSDLEKEGAFEAALKKHPEVTVFLHTASPVVFSAEDPLRDVINPAVNGTKNVLKAIKTTSPQITKVVLTASIVSMSDMKTKGDDDVTETSWNPITVEDAIANPETVYHASKKIAEKAAWEFIESEKPNFSLTTVHPVFVFGPQVEDEDAKGSLNLSNTFISNVLKYKAGDKVPEYIAYFVDVSDVAAAHVLAFEKEDAAGRRLLLSASTFSNQDILDIIHERVPELNGKIARGEPDKEPSVTASVIINGEKSREFLGLKYVSLSDSIASTVRQYVKANNL